MKHPFRHTMLMAMTSATGAALATGCAPPSIVEPQPSATVRVDTGELRGLDDPETRFFQGFPYAGAPIAEPGCEFRLPHQLP